MSLCLRNQIFTSSSSSSSSSSSILIIIIIFLLLPTSTINFSDVQREIEKLLRIRETPQSHSQSHNHYDIFFFLMWFSLFFFFFFVLFCFFFFFQRESLELLVHAHLQKKKTKSNMLEFCVSSWRVIYIW